MPHGLVMALDIAGNTGIAEGFPNTATPKLHSQRFSLEDDVSPTIAFGRAVAWMALRLQVIEPIAVFVEEYVPEFAFAGKTNASATIIRSGLYGALTGVSRAKGIPVIKSSIARVRTHMLGRGHGLKGGDAKQAIFYACKDRGWQPANKDESDAGAIWLWACEQVAGGLLDTGLPL